MDEQDWANRFSHDVDGLLSKSKRVDFEPLTEDYRETFDVARILAKTDFSHESQERRAVRRQLLDSFDAPAVLMSRGKQTKKIRRRLLVSIAGALALLLAMIITFGPVVAAQRISNGLKIVVLDVYTTVERIESVVTGQPMPDDSWHVSLPCFVAGGNGLPGTRPEVPSVEDLIKAQEITSFNIQLSSYLPEGYRLKEIKLAPILTGVGALLFQSNPTAYLIHVGPCPYLVIVQNPVGPQPIYGSGSVAGQFTTLATNGPIVEVDINGINAAWVDDCILIWEQGVLSYMVGGL
jgi:hypothetical protein